MESLTDLFKKLKSFSEPELQKEILKYGKILKANKGDVLIKEGQYLDFLPIVISGGLTYSALGTDGSSGQKLFCLSGHVAKPGVYEVTYGITLREMIALAGGVSGSGTLRAVLLGGAAGSFVGPADLDVPLTIEATRAIGASLGSGVICVFDDTVDLVDQVRRIAAFFRNESCGQCVPCRVGTVRQQETLTRIAIGSRPDRTRADELSLLQDLGQVMRDASICGLGQTAHNAIDSAIKLGVFA